MRNVFKVLFSVALGAALALPATLILAGDAGPDPSRCLQACRNIKLVYDAVCQSTCPELFPMRQNLPEHLREPGKSLRLPVWDRQAADEPDLTVA